jgi:hypothetical protein
MEKTKWQMGLVTALFLAMGLGGIGMAACGAADTAIDCTQICTRYEECVDSEADTSMCIDQCQEKAADDDDFEDQVESCESCIEEKSCTEAAVCVADCAGVVP